MIIHLTDNALVPVRYLQTPVSLSRPLILAIHGHPVPLTRGCLMWHEIGTK